MNFKIFQTNYMFIVVAEIYSFAANDLFCDVFISLNTTSIINILLLLNINRKRRLK